MNLILNLLWIDRLSFILFLWSLGLWIYFWRICYRICSKWSYFFSCHLKWRLVGRNSGTSSIIKLYPATCHRKPTRHCAKCQYRNFCIHRRTRWTSPTDSVQHQNCTDRKNSLAVPTDLLHSFWRPDCSLVHFYCCSFLFTRPEWTFESLLNKSYRKTLVI